MKNRSHRLPIAETHDDWVDGSWTVDCVCGVNFDDGEEMVNCDECGVWVHTRCSRYVKSEKSFACDKCKSRGGRNSDREETEVAQLLVDLPNTTLRMDNLYPINGPSQGNGKLYTQISTEKKVHVHGVPGGDPSLFAGLSSVFSPQLWKCTGYVPKKFNFQYKEFPSWDEKEADEVEGRNLKESDNAAENENTAGVLFSLLKDGSSVTPLGCSEYVKPSGDNRESVEKDANLHQVAVVESLKHKKKEKSKDRHERKRSAIREKGKDCKKKARITSTTASTISSDGKQLEFYEDRGPNVIKGSTESSKNGDSRHPETVDKLSNGPGIKGITTNNDNKHADEVEHDVETNKFDSSRCYTNSDGRLKEDNTEDQIASEIGNSHQVKEVGSGTRDSPRGSSDKTIAEFQKAPPVVEHLAGADVDVIDSKNIQRPIGDDSISSGTNARLKTEVDENHDVLNVHHSPSSEEKLEDVKLSVQQIEVSAINISENVKKSDLAISSSEISDQMQDGDKITAGDRKSSSQLKTGSKHVEGVCKLDAKPSSSEPNHLKVSVGKSSSDTYKSSTSGSHSPKNFPFQFTSRKQRGMSDGIKDEGRIERSKKIAKDTPESCKSPASKVSKSSRFSQPSVPKGSSSPKDSVVSNVHNKVVDSGLPEKSDKTSQHDSEPSSKVHASQMQPPVSSNPLSGLSDEELALLLHQELNSSPRVPRVPRMRHAGSLPQLTSPTATSMLMKRTASSGGKDFISSRRKQKEVSARDVSDEAKEVDRISPDLRGPVECGLPKDPARKKKPSSSNVNGYKASSTKNSPRRASNEDSRAAPLTLPGLIAKIMSKGERMTLEELCDTVLPHWPHLRKHNGEPYAYSSHTNAVLDCLRNRSEWARLVDRGPKINTSKKRRKSDDDPSGAESEDNVGRRERTTKDGRSKSLESQQEEFPKGKRQARKRRRLAPNGKGIREFRRRRRVEVVSDEEDGSVSDSSGDSKFSEDEVQGDGTSGSNEASTSSDETSN